MTSSLHVLMVPSWYPSPQDLLSGIFFREQALAIRDEGFRVGVIHPDLRSLRTIGKVPGLRHRFQVEIAEDEGIPTLAWRGWNATGLGLPRKLFVHAAKLLARRYVARYGKPDLLHAQGCLWGGVAARVLAVELGVPYVITEHAHIFLAGRVPFPVPPWASDAFRSAAKVLAVSRILSSGLQPLIPNKAIDIVPNMTDTDFFVGRDRKQGQGFHILAIAILNANKGFDVLLRAFAQAFKGEPGVALSIGGGGSEGPMLVALAAELGVQDQVHFLGILDRDQVRQTMWDADLFVVSSHQETFSIVLIEAMATGLPVVATRCGGPEEIVEPGTGWLVEPGDPVALAESLKVARQERSGLDPARIRSAVTSRFSRKIVTGKILRAYHEAVHGISEP